MHRVAKSAWYVFYEAEMFSHRNFFARGLMVAPHPQLARHQLTGRLIWLWLLCALAAPGCANCKLPRIDPTGERLFIWNTPSQPLLAGGTIAPPFGGTAPPYASSAPPFAGATPPPTLPGGYMPGAAVPLPGLPGAPPAPGITVSPSQVIAPVGSEVVMIATVIGEEGYPLTREKVEWMLDANGPGQLVSPGRRRPWDILNCLHHYPKKISPHYAINRTLTGPMKINRGTPTASDDIEVNEGQSWISVTSAAEGTSHVTVYAPNIDGWDRRQQSATIYWVDAQWRFPSPGISPAGGRNTLTTVVSRQSDGGPLTGWIVRYEIAGGPAAALAPDGQQSVEIITNANGEAPAEIYQDSPTPGSNTINIQVLRPPSAVGQANSPPIGSGTVVQTWTSGDATFPTSPPPGQPPVFTPVPMPQQTMPPAQQMPPYTPPQSQPPVVDQPPTLDPNTPVPQAQTPAPVATGTPDIQVTITAPPIAVVGSDVQFEIAVTNRGTSTATGVLVTDRFEEGLEHASAPPKRAIERSLVDLHPGETTHLAVTFRAAKAGQLCQEVTVTATGIEPATARNCITANESLLGQDTSPPVVTPTPLPVEPTQPEQSPQASPTLATPQLSVTKRGPDSRRVGESALFEIEVTNNTEQTFRNVEIADNHEISLEPLRATGGSVWLSGNALGWKIDSIAPGATVRREIELKCLRETPRACNRVTVTATDMEIVGDEACLEILSDNQTPAAPTTPEAPPAGSPQLSVTAVETADPIRINGQTSYQVLLTNKGDASAFDVEVLIQNDGAMQLLRAEGPVHGTTVTGGVRFPAIRELRAGETQTFDLRYKGAAAGIGHVRVEVTARGIAAPITAEQTTEVLP